MMDMKKSKPYYLGSIYHMSSEIRRSLRVLVFQLIAAFVFLFIGQALVSANPVFRFVVNVLVILSFIALLLVEGSKNGEDDVAFSEIIHSKLSNNEIVNEFSKKRCFHPLKGFISGAIGFSPFIFIAFVLALKTNLQPYETGVLPTWVNAFERSDNVRISLDFYHNLSALSFVELLRLIVRLILFPLVNLLNTENIFTMYLFEILSPLIILLLSFSYGFGYLRGPLLRRKIHSGIRKNKKRQTKTKLKTSKTKKEPKEIA